MTKSINHKWVCGILVLLLLASCSEGNDKDGYEGSDGGAFASNPVRLYEGDWIVDRQVVGMAQLEVGATGLSVSFPWEYFSQRFAPQKTFPADRPWKMNVLLSDQGYSSTAIYYKLAPEAPYGQNGVSYLVMQDGSNSLIGLVSKESGTALFDMKNDMWSFSLKIDAIYLVEPGSHDSEVTFCQLDEPLVLLYNTKYRIR